ncbi:MAG TPA: hypothetical protein VML95_06245 [Longimicrobiales bacterium]|nr:hypothetical protein [Longimicrobiales bacterium]
MRRGSERGADPYLDLKIGLFFVAAALGLSGMLFGRPVLIYGAIVAIGVGLLLRFLRPRPSALDADHDGAEPDPRRASRERPEA